jgi:hypothetical protein
MTVAFRLRARPSINEWTPAVVVDFLESIGIDPDQRECFRKEVVDGSVLCQMSSTDLGGEPFKLPFGLRKTLLAEIAAQSRHAQARQKQQMSGKGVVLQKGTEPRGPSLSADALERIRKWQLDPSSGRLMKREPPLTDDELECWQYQSSWLVCPITSKAWARSDVVSTMGVALYHAPRFCSEKEKQRLFIEEDQARRYDAARKAQMDHTGTTFEREYNVYPAVEPPPMLNLPAAEDKERTLDLACSTDDYADKLQQLKTEASGLKGRSAAVQRQMFEGLAGSGGTEGSQFLGEDDVRRALEELKREPSDDDEMARKFGLYESYFSGVVDLRGDLFALWERGKELLKSHDMRSMSASLKRIDNFENLSIPERSRFWFVYHMMSTASENHGKMQRILEDLEVLFESACDQEGASDGSPVEELTDDPQLGTIQVIIGPAFDIDAYNDGVNGNAAKGIQSASDRGVLDMDRQYNAVNFQFFKQRAEAGVTREGAQESYERRLCTSRLSFYIEESHGSRVFPRNILSQLSLLFYRRNDALRLPTGQVNEGRVAVCIRKAIPRILRGIVVDVFHGDRGFLPHVEKAVRCYLAVHQVAIKLLATFRKSFALLYQSVVEWIQQPFCLKSDTQWPDLEELLLGASLCSLPWPLLREAFVRKLFVQLLRSTTQMSSKTPIRQRAEHLFSQNRLLLERVTYILTFFQTGPGRLPVQLMDKKYSRCAGSIPRAERDALVSAANEGAGISSLVELWTVLGMRGRDVEDEAALAHLEQFLLYVQANEAAWKIAPPPVESSEGPALPAAALEQLALIGAQTNGSSAAHSSNRPQNKRDIELAEAQRRAAEKAQHQGYPTLPLSRRLDGTMCYYCQRRFPSRMALFAHLRRVIDGDRFVEGHHQTHFNLEVPGVGCLMSSTGPHRCPAENCGKSFGTSRELWQHYNEMGVPGFEQPPLAEKTETPGAANAAGYVTQLEESGPPAASASSAHDGTALDANLTQCSVCMERPPEVVMVPCGHIYACEDCGKKLGECALCREPVSQVLRIYYSARQNS